MFNVAFCPQILYDDEQPLSETARLTSQTVHAQVRSAKSGRAKTRSAQPLVTPMILYTCR